MRKNDEAIVKSREAGAATGTSPGSPHSLHAVEEKIRTTPAAWPSVEAFVSDMIGDASRFANPKNPADQMLFLYQSRSSQSASFEAPRVITSFDYGRFIFTFTGGKENPSDAAVEIAESNPTTGVYRFAQVRFEDGRALFDKAPTTCAACHETRQRPIWDTYPFWPGVYGSVHGGSDAFLEVERPAWNRFVEKASTSTRYIPILPIVSKRNPGENSQVEQNIMFGKALSRTQFARVYTETTRKGVLDAARENAQTATRQSFDPRKAGPEEAQAWKSLLAAGEDKKMRARIAGVAPSENYLDKTEDARGFPGVFAFLTTTKNASLDVSSWSNASWYGPKSENELAELMRAKGVRPALMSAVTLFSNGRFGGKDLGMEPEKDWPIPQAP